MSLRDKIAAATDIDSEPLEVPEWGVTIDVRQFDLETRSDFLDKMGVGQLEDGEAVEGAIKRMYPAMLIAAVYDPETGEPVFTEADVPMLLSKNGLVVDRIGDVIMRLNGMTESAVEDAKKDSSGTPTSSTN